jgi:thiol:disulfide interchange protein DsbD
MTSGKLFKFLLGIALAAFILAMLSTLQAQGFSSARAFKATGVVSVDRIHPGTSFQLAVVVAIDHEWHVNAHKPSFDYLIPTLVSVEPAEGYSYKEPVYPPFQEKAFAFTGGKVLKVYEGEIVIGLDVAAGADLPPGEMLLKVKFSAQACNDTSCLAPGSQDVEVPVVIASPGDSVNLINQEIFKRVAFLPPDAEDRAEKGEENAIADAVTSRGFLFTFGLIFLGGLALNLTPCVYPLIPITVSYFGGQSSGSTARSFGLSSLYVLGMSVTYSILGVVAATTGGLLGSALQSPWVLGFVAVVLITLAMSMFGLFELSMPTSLTNKIQSRKGFMGALFMGLTVGLVAAPCIGPFVVGLLAYVGQTGDPTMGFAMFFVLSLGLGLPFLFLGTFSGAIAALPRTGAWMVWVRSLFGCVLVGMALWFLQPVLPDAVSRIGMAALIIASGLFLGFLERSDIRTIGFRTLRYGTAVAAVVFGAWFMIPSQAAGEGIVWEEFERAILEQAAASNKPVIIDFTAEWCIACKELEHYTFSDPAVSAEAERFLTLRADMTSFTAPPIDEIKEHFGILGLPWVVFIDSQGKERSDLRVTGFLPSEEFLARMKKVDS